MLVIVAKNDFPDGFLWGAATAAHQVEGGIHNQWSVWERQNADDLARTAQKRLGWLPNWPVIAPQAETADNYVSGRGVEHYTRYKDDFALIKQLNMNAFRFSIEWSRIEPQEGQWNEDGIAHYRRYIAELKRQGIEPIVTLWHWTVPTWFNELGEFEKRRNVRYFVRFVAKIAAELGEDFTYVTLLNEPNVHAAESYIRATRPPQRRNLILAIRVLSNLAFAQRAAYQALKKIRPNMQIGIAFALTDVQPAQKNRLFNYLIVWVSRYAANWWFLDRVRTRLDFIGVNYYFTSYLNWRGQLCNPPGLHSDLGWYMEPSGIYRILMAVWRRYRKPLIVTENGLADRDDTHRQWWLQQTVDALSWAVRAGVDLRGYLHWSLIDNFEWEQGFWPNFGLIAVDRKTMKRRIRASARWFADYIEHVRH